MVAVTKKEEKTNKYPKIPTIEEWKATPVSVLNYVHDLEEQAVLLQNKINTLTAMLDHRGG